MNQKPRTRVELPGLPINLIDIVTRITIKSLILVLYLEALCAKENVCAAVVQFNKDDTGPKTFMWVNHWLVRVLAQQIKMLMHQIEWLKQQDDLPSW